MEERGEAKLKGERERYTQLKAENAGHISDAQ